jgi:NADH:ubiquinone oxidoreductase subunit E
MNGSRAIITTLRDNLKIDMGETTSDGLFTLETAECLGQCDTAPGLSIHETYYGGMTVPKIIAILQEYRDQEKRREEKKVR